LSPEKTQLAEALRLEGHVEELPPVGENKYRSEGLMLVKEKHQKSNLTEKKKVLGVVD